MGTTYEQELAATTGRGGVPPKLPRQLQQARSKENVRRRAMAQRRALTILSRRHKDEYSELYEAFVAEIFAELGPLPGDAS